MPIKYTFIAGLLSFIFFKFYIFIVSYMYFIFNEIKFHFFRPLSFIGYKKNVINEGYSLKEFMYPFSFVKNLIFNGYYFNEIYNYYLYKNKKLSFSLMKNLDRGLIEYIGHLFIVNFINKISFIFSKKHSGRIDYFVFTIIVGVILINILLIL
jgi:hypothetical protein